MTAAAGDNHFNPNHSSVAQRSTRRTSTDVSMPDYVPAKSDSQCVEQQLAPEPFPGEDGRQSEQSKAPINAPSADVEHKREGRVFREYFSGFRCAAC